MDKSLKEGGQDRIWDHFQNEGVDSFSGSKPRLRYLVGRLNSNSKVLNIGVGGAIFEDMALRENIDVYSLDPNERSIEALRNRTEIGDKAQVGYSENIPFNNEQFDTVVMSEVLEHLSQDVFEKSIKEVVRVLRHGGDLIVTVPFDEVLESNYAVCPKCGEAFHRWGHQQSFNINRLKGLLERESLLVKEARTICFPDWSRKGWVNLVKSSLRCLLGAFGVQIAQPNIFLRATKT